MWQYSLPTIVNPEGDLVLVRCTNPSNFIEFDEKSNTLFIKDLSDPTIEPGIYEITVELATVTHEETFVIKLIVQELVPEGGVVVDQVVGPAPSTSEP